MTWYEWVGIGLTVYIIVGVLAWALMKTASDADDAMEAWTKEDYCVHDD
jgi:hypothetical protein